MFNKISDADLTGKGVIGLPDTPGLPTAEMQEKLEETARSVIVPKFNALVDALNGTGGAASMGCTKPDGTDPSNVQTAMDGLQGQLYAKAAAADVYTKAQADAMTDEKIAEKMTAIGAGDMQKAVYDPDNDGKVTNAVNADKAANAEQLGGYGRSAFLRVTSFNASTGVLYTVSG